MTSEDGVRLVTGPLVLQFVSLTRALLDSGSVGAVLERVVVATRDLVPGADLVSVTLRAPDGAFHTPVRTGEIAGELEAGHLIQYDAPVELGISLHRWLTGEMDRWGPAK